MLAKDVFFLLRWELCCPNALWEICHICHMGWSGRYETENIATLKYYSYLGPVLQPPPGYAPSPLVRLRC